MSETKIQSLSVNTEKSGQNKNLNQNQNKYTSNYQKRNIKNKRSSNKIVNKNKKLKIKSVSELEFLYGDSQVKTTLTNKNLKLKTKNLINLSSNNQNSTDILSTKVNKHSRQDKITDDFQTRTFNNFLKRVKEHEKEKHTKINNLNGQILEDNKEFSYKPKISKRSLSLVNLKKRKPLYLTKPLNEEIYLDKDFTEFYKNNLNTTYKVSTNALNEQKTQQKFNKFYEDNIVWKKKINENNQSLYDNNKKKEIDSKIYTFKPTLNKNSFEIIQKIERFNNINMDPYNNLISMEEEKEILEQFKIQLKPILNEYFDSNNKNVPYVNKKSLYMIRNMNNNSIKKLNRNKSNILHPKNDKLDLKKIRSKSNLENKKENFNDKNKQKFRNLNKNAYEKYLSLKFIEINNKNSKSKKELYKLNIRQGTSWNSDSVNKIIPKKKYRFIVEGLL